MDSRQQFEEWYCESDKGPQVEPMWMVYNEERNTYGLDLINRDWVAWQASRAAIVIELPPSIGITPIGGDGIQEYIDCNGEYLHGFAVVESIINAGLTLK